VVRRAPYSTGPFRRNSFQSLDLLLLMGPMELESLSTLTLNDGNKSSFQNVASEKCKTVDN
jgi:hypothetical protein